MTDRGLMEDIDEALASRTPRKTREQAERPKVWQPASTLPEPDKLPGYVYRWVRVASLGQNDARDRKSTRLNSSH